MAIKSLLVIGMVLIMESYSIAGQVPIFHYKSEFAQTKLPREILNFDNGCEVDLVNPYAQEYRYSMRCNPDHAVYFGVEPGLYPYRYTGGRGTVSPSEMELISW